MNDMAQMELASSAGSSIRAFFSYSGFSLALHTAGDFISSRGPSPSPQENKDSPMELHAEAKME